MFAVAALAACTSEQTIVAPQNEAIGFDTFVDNSTRAEDITTANIADFGVYGTVTKGGNSALIFKNTEVTKSGDDFVYSPAQYWIAAAEYDFLAFAPYTNAKWAYTPTNAQVAKTGTFSFNNAAAAADQDVVYAYQTKTTADKLDASNTQAVEFTFKHILSKVAFSFTNTFTDNNTSLSVYNVKINNTAKTGTMAIAEGVDADWVGVDNLVVPFGDQATAVNTLQAKAIANNNGTLKLAHHYVIPAQRAYNITFSVDLYQAGVYLATYNHTIESTINFAKNGNYVLSVKLAPESIDPANPLFPIEFTVNEVEDWRDNGSVALTKPVEVATADALKAAIAAGENVKLTADITLDEPLQITNNAIVDLNGNDITADLFLYPGNTVEEDSYAFWVKNGGDLTITGEGEISTADCKYSIAVWAQGGKVTINGGTFKNAGEGSDLIYASANGHVVINGGEFVACEKQAGVDGTLEAYSALNLKGDGTGSSITCYGGRFFKFNPANNKSENPAVSFVAPGYESVVDGDYFEVVAE